MKTITCRKMGGPCDAPLSANTYDEMMKVGMDHLKMAHPEMVESIEKMPKDDPMMVKWDQDFRKTWADTPDV
jgi:predicted small metal-binding protein